MTTTRAKAARTDAGVIATGGQPKESTPPDLSPSAISLLDIEPQPIGGTNVSVALQKCVLHIIAAFDGEIISGEAIGAYAAVDRRSAQAAAEVLDRQGFISREPVPGNLSRYTVQWAKIAESTRYHPINSSVAPIPVESEARAYKRWHRNRG